MTFALLIADMKSGDIMFAAGNTEKFLGYETDELVGVCVDTLVPESKVVEHVKARESFYRFPRERKMGAGSLPALRKDGTVRQVDISLHPVGNGTIIVFIIDPALSNHPLRT